MEFATGSYNKLMEIIKTQKKFLEGELNDSRTSDILKEYTQGKLDMLDILEVLIEKHNLVEI